MTQHVPVLRRRRLARTACAAVALVAAASLAPAVPALAGPAKARPAVTSQFFGVHHQGMHADGPIGWPRAALRSFLPVTDRGRTFVKPGSGCGLDPWRR